MGEKAPVVQRQVFELGRGDLECGFDRGLMVGMVVGRLIAHAVIPI